MSISARILTSIVAAILVSNAASLSTLTSTPATVTSPISIKSESPMIEPLKVDKTPKFDVIEKTKCRISKEGQSHERGLVRSEDYQNQKGLDIRTICSEIRLVTFGHSIDPEDPYRCFYFQQWRGVDSGDMKNSGKVHLTMGNEMETPVSVFSVLWNSEGKIVYEQIGVVANRGDGNTGGKGNIFEMLQTAGTKLSANSGDMIFSLIQRLGDLAGNSGRNGATVE